MSDPEKPSAEAAYFRSAEAKTHQQAPRRGPCDRKPVYVATCAPGTVFGEPAVLDAGPRSATVIADEDLVCFVLTPNFAALTAKYPDVADPDTGGNRPRAEWAAAHRQSDHPSAGNIDHGSNAHMQDERFSENLRQLAVEAWEVAGRLCGPCRDLHVLWPFQRLAGSPGQDVAAIEPVLNRLLSPPRRRVLIAGCADTGLLALVARTANPATAIAVVDRCETPLELCRRFAGRWAITVDTKRLDLMELTETPSFDLVFAHELLQHIPADRRVDTLSRMRRAMRADGRLVLVFHTSNRVDGNVVAAYRQHFPQHLIEQLEASGVSLPEPREAFRRRAEAYSDEWREREGAFGSWADVGGLLGAAGFEIEELVPIQVDRPKQFRELAAKVNKQRFLAVARSR